MSLISKLENHSAYDIKADLEDNTLREEGRSYVDTVVDQGNGNWEDRGQFVAAAKRLFSLNTQRNVQQARDNRRAARPAQDVQDIIEKKVIWFYDTSFDLLGKAEQKVLNYSQNARDLEAKATDYTRQASSADNPKAKKKLENKAQSEKKKAKKTREKGRTLKREMERHHLAAKAKSRQQHYSQHQPLFQNYLQQVQRTYTLLRNI
ncbi:hypothetical protein ACFL96_05850 [Thermoproteota archaeon]